MLPVFTIDNFLPDPEAVRAHALASEFIDYEGQDGQTYKRVAITDVPGLTERLTAHAGGHAPRMLGMGYRLNFGGELPNAAIHSDIGWGSHALVLYLSSPPPGEPQGTAFWRHRETGEVSLAPGDLGLLSLVENDWDQPEKWELVQLVQHQFNRALIYPSSLFHSRYPFPAFGTGPEDGRLIAVAFFNW